jgi:NADH-quinone oxidoreductase subunit K
VYHRRSDSSLLPKHEKQEEVIAVMVPTAAYLILAAVLFSMGVAAFLIKRNLITIFMSIELMLNAVNLTFVAFAHMWHQVSGQIFVFFVMVVAAAEAAVGLAIIIAIFRTRETLNVDSIDLMKS